MELAKIVPANAILETNVASPFLGDLTSNCDASNDVVVVHVGARLEDTHGSKRKSPLQRKKRHQGCYIESRSLHLHCDWCWYIQ